MERIRACLVALAVVSLCGVAQVRSSSSDHRYKAGVEVPLYANKVGPFHNPRYSFLPSGFGSQLGISKFEFPLTFFVCFSLIYSETYRYFDFPFCSSGLFVSILAFFFNLYK